MNGMSANLRPSWYTGGKRSRGRDKNSSSSESAESSSQLRLPFVRKRTTADEALAFEDKLAMHWFVSGNSFSRIEEENLKQAFKVFVFFFVCTELL
jgi:hypothetical protein